jgi:sugar phosphate isomerase/epimerase
MSKSPLAIQMYTVRDAAAQDFPGALQKVAELGYDAVELAGMFDLSATALRQILDDLGLQCISAHVALPNLRNNLDQEIETYLALGASYLVCPVLPLEERGEEAGYRALAAELNQIGERCRAKGIQFCYHHHAFELVQFNGKYGLDILLEDSDPANVQLQADVYWLHIGGEDPATYIRQWPGRVPLIHLKDVSATEPPTFAEVGAGILAWPEILAVAKENGAQWYIVEQDRCPGDPFESAKISIDNYRKMV